MGDNPASERDYKTEYANAKKRGDLPKIYARIKARREMVKEYGKEALQGKDIDHITPLRDHGKNVRSNWRVSSERANRNWRKNQKGYD